MKNHEVPPAFTSAPPVECANAQVSIAKCTVVGAHCDPVRSAIIAGLLM